MFFSKASAKVLLFFQTGKLLYNFFVKNHFLPVFIWTFEIKTIILHTS